MTPLWSCCTVSYSVSPTRDSPVQLELRANDLVYSELKYHTPLLKSNAVFNYHLICDILFHEASMLGL